MPPISLKILFERRKAYFADIPSITEASTPQQMLRVMRELAMMEPTGYVNKKEDTPYRIHSFLRQHGYSLADVLIGRGV